MRSPFSLHPKALVAAASLDHYATGRKEIAPTAHRIENGENIRVAVGFTDFADYTRKVEGVDPALVHARLNLYDDVLGSVIERFGCEIDNLMGDSMMFYISKSPDRPDYTRRALDAAIAMQQAIRRINGELKTNALKSVMTDPLIFEMRVGVHSGFVHKGELGPTGKSRQTLIGDTVNLAQRLESAAPSGGILVSESVKDELTASFVFQPREIRAKGIGVIKAYEVSPHPHPHPMMSALLVHQDDVARGLLFQKREEEIDRLLQNGFIALGDLVSGVSHNEACRV